MASVSVQLVLLAVAKDPSRPDLGDATIANERATAAGHRVLAQQVVADSEAAIREALEHWIADPAIDVVIVLGGADSDAVSTAMRPLVGHVLPGFTDLFRYLFFQEAGASAMLSAAEAARCTDTFVFVLPGAVAAAMEKLILPQFDPATTPKNLVGQMPRLRAERDAASAPVVAVQEDSAGHGVPREVPPEKTQGGSGVSARLPAMPAPRRDQKRTGANVISRNPAPVDPPTRPIELARLEQELAASQGKEDITRRTDLQKLLPRVPPGADDIDDDDEDAGDVTSAEIIAAPPAKPFTVPTVKPVTAPIARITPVPAQVKPPERITPPPTGQVGPTGSAAKTPLPSVAKPPAPRPVEAPKPVEPAAAVTIQPRKRDSQDAKGFAKPVERANGTPVRTPAHADEAKTIARTDEAKTTARAHTDEAKTKVRPVVVVDEPAASKPVPRTSGTFGVLSDADLEPVDTDSDSADLDAIRAAATAESDEAPTVSRAEPVRVKAPTPPPVTMVTAVPPAPTPRTRPPTAPPAKVPEAARTRPPSAPIAETPRAPTEPPRARPATAPPPPRTTNELPSGTFSYPPARKGMHWAVKLLLVLVVLGAGFGGFVFFFRDKLGAGEGSGSGAPIATTSDAAVVASAELDAAAEATSDAGATTDEPEIEMAPTPTRPTTQRPPTTTTTTRPPRGDRTKPPRGEPETGSGSATEVAAIDAGVALPTPPTGPSNTPPGAGDDECDETACVLSKYEKACCAKYKPAETTDIAPRAGDTPETLDKTMVRAGVNGVKPKVQKCGEKIAAKGTVKISMTVSPEGAVTEASVADSPDAALGQCVVAAMKLAKFGKSLSGASFTYPFVF